jgi:5-methylcytosine-specific restriction endonuclease McrA
MRDQDEGEVRPNYVATHVNGKRDYREEQAKFEAHIDALPDFPLRAPCRCGSERGKGPRDVSGQAMIYCAGCRRHAYNAPKHETGRGVRKILNREAIDSFTKSRILERDNSTCLDCGKRPPDVILNVSHMISVADAVELGFGPEDYNDDENLYSGCEECNAVQGKRSITKKRMARMILLHNRFKRESAR